MPIDTTVGGAGANSYLTSSDADGFARLDLGRFAKAWLDATDEQKEAALRRATREIDTYVGVLPEEAYYYLTATQALRFPRAQDVNLAGVPIIPTDVARATYLQAAYLVANADQIDDAAMRRSKGYSSYVNPDGTGGTVASSASQGRLHPDVETMLGAFDQTAVVGWIRTT